MAKRRRRHPRGSKQPKTKPQQAHFTAFEEEFFRTGESLHLVPAVELPAELEPEPESSSVWRRLFARITLAA